MGYENSKTSVQAILSLHGLNKTNTQLKPEYENDTLFVRLI
jgi:hypothetical protein